MVSPSWQVLTLAVSGDGRYLASGGRDRLINVWDCRTNTVVETFRGHQDTVSSLTFRANSLALFSGSHDRCVKVRVLSSQAAFFVPGKYNFKKLTICLSIGMPPRSVLLCFGRDTPKLPLSKPVAVCTTSFWFYIRSVLRKLRGHFFCFERVSLG